MALLHLYTKELSTSEFEKEYEVDDAADYIYCVWVNGHKEEAFKFFMELNPTARDYVLDGIEGGAKFVYEDFVRYLMKKAYLEE